MEFNISEFLSNPAALSAAVIAITAFLKTNVFTGASGNRTILISLGVSTVLVGAAIMQAFYPAVINTIVLIIMGSFGGGGILDTIKGVAGSVAKAQEKTLPPLPTVPAFEGSLKG